MCRMPARKVTAYALRMAANSLQRSQSALGDYFRRMKARLGAPAAITATAHNFPADPDFLLPIRHFLVSVCHFPISAHHSSSRPGVQRWKPTSLRKRNTAAWYKREFGSEPSAQEYRWYCVAAALRAAKLQAPNAEL